MWCSGKRVVLLTLVALNCVEQPAPEVRVSQGALVGTLARDGTHYRYLGIPYASTNSHTRFQPPGPAPSWQGVFRATEEGAVCPQPSLLGGVMGAEECLHMNVYVPVQGRRPLPVMVFIHGGAYTMGSGGQFVYGPEYLVAHDIILVTFNYRLGALGFLCLNTPQVPGNAGLRDQISALRWVKENIAAFGGDPDNITLFGESAGATSTDYMMLTNATDGLFNRAIVQSGGATSSWGLNTDPVWTASLLAEVMGFQSNDTNELYKFFSRATINDLVYAKTEKPWSVFLDTQLIYLPCVDRYHPGIEPVVPDIPYNMFTSPQRKNISVIYGSNDKEGLFLMNFETADNLNRRNEGYLFASNLGFNSSEEARKTAQQVQQYYFGDERISSKTLLNLSHAYTHMYFEIPAFLQTDILVSTSSEPVYNYHFNYAGYRNVVKILNGYWSERGASHGDDLFYMFDARFLPSVFTSAADRRLIHTLTTMWTNFAKYGDPTPTPVMGVRWFPSSRHEHRVLYIGEELRMGPLPDTAAYTLWRDIYHKYRKKQLLSYTSA